MYYPTDPYEFIWNELFEPKEERGDEFEVELKNEEKYYETKYENRNIPNN